MDIRLNKFISDSGLCSRREADKFIEMGRVTVNGQQPVIGQRVSEQDVVLVDGEPVRWGKRSLAGQIKAAPGKSAHLISDASAPRPRARRSSPSASQPAAEGAPGTRREHYGKFNKYAAARHAAKERGEEPVKPKRPAPTPTEGLHPKAAALRKTSRNNPLNTAKRRAERKRKERGDE